MDPSDRVRTIDAGPISLRDQGQTQCDYRPAPPGARTAARRGDRSGRLPGSLSDQYLGTVKWWTRQGSWFTDEGISGSQGRDKRPGYDALLKGVARRDFEMIAAWSVDRLGRSLPHLVGFLGDIQAKGVDLYLHQQGLDTSTPSGRAMFGMLGVFSEFERAMIRERILSGLRRTSKKSGRKPMADDRLQAIRKSLANGLGIRATARLHAASPMTVTKIAREMAPPEPIAA